MTTLRLPRCQYTARDVVSGLVFWAYAQERSLTYASLFAERVLADLRACSVELNAVSIQTDNGSEFLANVTTYQAFFNYARTNSSKAHQTPMEIIRKRNPAIHPTIGLLPPVFLETSLPKLYTNPPFTNTKKGIPCMVLALS